MSETVTTTALRDFDPRQVGVLIEAKLVEWGIRYEYDPAVAIAGLEKVQQAQVRALEHQHDQDTIDQYATFMRAGVVFPPLVLLRENIILDGNTRIAAAKQARVATLPAFKCDFANPDLAVAFAGAINQMGGRRLGPVEARRQAEILMRYNYEDDAIARELGYGRTHVNNWRREHEAAERAKATQVTDMFDKVSRPAQRQLAGIKLNGPFAAATNLIAETRLPAKEVTRLVKAVQAAPSEAEAMNAVTAARQTVVAAGPPPHRATVPAEVAQVRRLLPQLVNLAANPLAVIEPETDKRDAAIAQWITVRDFAAEVVNVYGSH